MNAQQTLQLLLVLHITGFTVMAGTIVADFTLNKRVGRYLISDRSRAATMLESTDGFARLIGLGAALLLLTGIGMVIVYKGVVAHALWFRIKMILVVLVALNGSLILRRQGNRMKALLSGNGTSGQILSLKQNMTVFHVIELLLFLIIFILSVFQF